MPSHPVSTFVARAKKGDPVFITDVRGSFSQLGGKSAWDLILVLDLLPKGEKRAFEIRIPSLDLAEREQVEFVTSYLRAEVYNILSTLGGTKLTIYLDRSNRSLVRLAETLYESFDTHKSRSQRKGYGRAINVIERIRDSQKAQTHCADSRFSFRIEEITRLPILPKNGSDRSRNGNRFEKATKLPKGKTICGIDIGGTSIKLVLVADGTIRCCKEYGWFPAGFKTASEQIDPILLLVRLARAKLSCESGTAAGTEAESQLKRDLERAFAWDASYETICDTVKRIESLLDGKLMEIDAIGVSFPDVVIKDKIVGGEVYKMRGMRENAAIDFEREFARITHLDTRLLALCKKGGVVKIINDGSMAAFTAAVEMAARNEAKKGEEEIFAHTLGTELGTGWVTCEGSIPEIPLEVYNIVIDLGSFVERGYHNDDARSINNFNTGLPGTLQKYTSQSGVFRLALKYLPEKRPDLYRDLFHRGLLEEAERDGNPILTVPTEPSDRRKALMKHIIRLLEREKEETVARIFREIGVFLAITWLETERLLRPKTKSRYLFGGLLADRNCRDLIRQGACSRVGDIRLDVADEKMANTSLMKQFGKFSRFSVSQFALAIGAVHYANLELSE